MPSLEPQPEITPGVTAETGPAITDGAAAEPAPAITPAASLEPAPAITPGVIPDEETVQTSGGFNHEKLRDAGLNAVRTDQPGVYTWSPTTGAAQVWGFVSTVHRPDPTMPLWRWLAGPAWEGRTSYLRERAGLSMPVPGPGTVVLAQCEPRSDFGAVETHRVALYHDGLRLHAWQWVVPPPLRNDGTTAPAITCGPSTGNVAYLCLAEGGLTAYLEAVPS